VTTLDGHQHEEPVSLRPVGRCPSCRASRPRAPAYIAALMVWAAGFLVMIVRFSGQEQVRTVSQGIQLVAMFAACSVIFGVAVLVSREVDRWPLYGTVSARPTSRH